MTSNTRFPGITFVDGLRARMDNAARALQGLPPRTHGRRAARDGVGAINVDKGQSADVQIMRLEDPKHRA